VLCILAGCSLNLVFLISPSGSFVRAVLQSLISQTAGLCFFSSDLWFGMLQFLLLCSAFLGFREGFSKSNTFGESDTFSGESHGVAKPVVTGTGKGKSSLERKCDNNIYNTTLCNFSVPCLRQLKLSIL